MIFQKPLGKAPSNFSKHGTMCEKRGEFQLKLTHVHVLLYCCLACLSRIIHPYGDAGEGLQILAYAWH